VSSTGFIEGQVTDDRGLPLAGVTVSATGATTALALTDRQGKYSLRPLPAGGYLVRAAAAGFIPSRHQFLQVNPSSATRYSVALQRSAAKAKAAKAGTPEILAAGLVPGSSRAGTDTVADPSADDHSETAWRLRHLRRSVLKQTTDRVNLGEVRFVDARPGTLAVLSRAIGSSPSSFGFGDLPISGQVNLLTSGSFDGTLPFQRGNGVLRGVAYLSIAGPGWGGGEWSAQAMTEGDHGSWFLSTSYRRRVPGDHVYSLGFSYSTQRFSSAPRWPIGKGSDGARTAGSFTANDEWRLSSRVLLALGASYARYDYLPDPGLFSPRVNVTVIPLRGMRVHGSVSRRVLAPGAEEFLEPLTTGLWVPAERTFSGLTPLVAQRTDHFELGVQQQLLPNLSVNFRAFHQETGDQQVAFFDLGSLVPAGQYGVASIGDLAASGWSIGVSGSATSRLRGSVAYGVSSARWLPSMADALLLVGIATRPGDQRIHDLTTSLQAELPVTSTRVYLTYKLNSGFARRTEGALDSEMADRFDLQVVQRLPFMDFTSARWQALFAVRNLFRDSAVDASIYDELLVVHPPKRVVTGLLVRF
jgi:hypothetical protein